MVKITLNQNISGLKKPSNLAYLSLVHFVVMVSEFTKFLAISFRNNLNLGI
jgi:hypothetical protein